MEKTTIFVSPDDFAGAVQALHACSADAVELRFRGGDYFLTETVRLTPDDPQTITFAGEPGETVRISAGQRISPVWEVHAPGIWKASIGGGRTFDTLRADGVRQILCRYPNYCEGEILNGCSADALSPLHAGRIRRAASSGRCIRRGGAEIPTGSRENPHPGNCSTNGSAITTAAAA